MIAMVIGDIVSTFGFPKKVFRGSCHTLATLGAAKSGQG